MHFHNQSGAISLNNNSITGSARGVLVNGGSAAWTITGNTVGGGQAGQGPRGGFEFVGLSAQSTLSCTDNTLSHVGGVAMSFMNSKAAATVANNAINNAWGDQGGQCSQNQGIGLMAVDSSALTLDGNQIQDNHHAGLLIDLKWWDTTADGAPVITIRNNTVNGHSRQLNFKRQFIPTEATITVENNTIPPLGPPTPGQGPPPPVAVARGETPAPPRCGDGHLDVGEQCEPGQPGAPINCSAQCELLEGFRDVRAYNRSFCAAAYDGTISCIGGPDTEQFGEAGRAFRDEFERNQAAPDGVLFKQSALGLLHGCALSQNGRIYCWGRNSFRQVTGLVANQLYATPQRVDHPEFGDLDVNPFVSVDVAHHHSCGRRASGHVWCWGMTHNNALGFGPNQNNVPFGPTKLPLLNLNDPENFDDLIAEQFWTGSHSSCAVIRQNDVLSYHCINTPDQTGFNKLIAVQTAQGDALTVGGSVVFGAGTDAYNGSTCALSAEGAAYCWGVGADYRLGNRAEADAPATAAAAVLRAFPGRMPTLRSLAAIPHGLNNEEFTPPITCGVTTDGEVWCWGTSERNLLPESLVYQGARRIELEGLGRVRKLAISQGLACGVMDDYRMTCWGADTFRHARQIGTHQPAQLVQRAPGLDAPALGSVGLGDGFGVAQAGNQAYWWGKTPSGVLPKLRELPGADAVASLAVARRAVCYSAPAGITCKGQLAADENEPFFNGVIGETDTLASAVVRCGSYHCCAFIQDDQSAWCWGESDRNQVGPDVLVYRNALRVAIGEPITEMALGRFFTCAGQRENTMLGTRDQRTFSRRWDQLTLGNHSDRRQAH